MTNDERGIERKNVMKRLFQSRLHMLLAIVAAGLVVIVFGQQPPTAAAQARFVGGEPSRPDSSDIRALRLRFEAGVRSNWHSHAGWQILAAEEGHGRTQARGGAVQDLVPGGTPVYTGPDVVHWHGASPDEHVVQLTFIAGGSATWYEPVSDADYRAR